MSDSRPRAPRHDPLSSEPPLQEPQSALAEVIDAPTVARGTSSVSTTADTIATSKPPQHDAYEALRYHNFRLLLAGAFVAVFAQQMITVAIGWELYQRTNAPLALGAVGLAQILPVVLLFLPSGYLVDRYSRKRYPLHASLPLPLTNEPIHDTGAGAKRFATRGRCSRRQTLARASLSPE